MANEGAFLGQLKTTLSNIPGLDEVRNVGDKLLSNNPRGDLLNNLIGNNPFSSTPQINFNILGEDDTDWRVKLIARDKRYLQGPLLKPLANTGGLVFPYTPQLGITHSSGWNPSNPAHTNSAVYQYSYSQVDNIIVTGDFTAQNHFQAQYCLAAVHFLRAVTKMNYGQDPDAGTPPPLLFLQGLGEHILPNIPVLVLSSYLDFPPDVDYITANINGSAADLGIPGTINMGADGDDDGAEDNVISPFGAIGTMTKIPTQFAINITLGVAHSRESISTKFSLKNFINGQMLGDDNFGGYI